MTSIGPGLRRKLLAFNYGGTALLLGCGVLWLWNPPDSAHPPLPSALDAAVRQVVAHQQHRLQQDGRFATFNSAPGSLAAALPEAAEEWSHVPDYRITATHAPGGGLHLHILPDPVALRAEKVAPIAYSVELTSAGAVKDSPGSPLRSEGAFQ